MHLLPLLVLLAAEPPPSFDAFVESPLEVPLGSRLPPTAREKLSTAWASQVEPRLGVPTVLWVPPPPAGQRPPRAQGLTAEEAARRALFEWAPVYRFAPAALAEAKLLEVHDPGDGAVVVRFAREVNGLPALRDTLNVVMTQKLEVVALTGALSPWTPTLPFNLTPETALTTALFDLTGVAVEAKAVPRIAVGTNGWRFHATAGGRFTEPPRVRKAYYGTARALVPAYQVDAPVLGADGRAWDFLVVVSAVDGAVLSRTDLEVHATHSYRVWAGTSAPFAPMDGPQGDGLTPDPAGTPQPTAIVPITPVLVTLDNAGLSTGDPWLPPGATSLSGNNVNAYADLYPPDGFNEPDAGLPKKEDGGVIDAGTDDAGVPWQSRRDFDVAPSSPGSFDFTYDFARAPEETPAQLSAAATQAFFTANWAHDVLYDYGFDEQSGNAQANNLGRGGQAGDALRVEVSDFANTDNASMRTPPDGRAPRMHVYRFTGATRAAVSITAPAGAAADLESVSFGPRGRSWDVSGDVVPVVDAADGGLEGCSGFANAAQVAGNVALLGWGECDVLGKIDAAWDAGAAGVVLVRTAASAQAPTGTLDAMAPPAHLVFGATETQALLDAVDGGAAVTVRLRRSFSQDRAGALDSSVVLHEYAHALTNRLVADGAGLGTVAAGALGEGWSDFFALWAGLRPTDTQVMGNAVWQGAFAIGQYADGDVDFLAQPSDDAYFGLRRVPYSTDRAKNALTYKHVGLNVPLPTTTPLRANEQPNTEVHNAGEVWCTALWEGQAALLNDSRYTFDTARRRMLRVVVGGLKATPAFPTFLEARDAVLAVARATDSLDFNALLGAFASRGFGMGAMAPDRKSRTNTPLAEDFSTTGGALRLMSATIDDDVEWCDRDGSLDSEEQGTLTLRVMNASTQPATDIPFGLAAGPGLQLTSPTPVTASLQPFETAEVRLPVRAPAWGTTLRPFDVTVSTPGGPSSTLVFEHRFNTDVVASDAENFEHLELEDPAMNWEVDTAGGYGLLDGFQRISTSTTNFVAWSQAPDVAGEATLTTPPLRVGTGALSFTFLHAYGFEFDSMTSRSFDGAVLEVSTDDDTWTQIPGSALTPGYPGTLDPATDNPLAGRPAFVGNLASMTLQTVNLGTQYAGQTIRVRFRVGTDSGGPATGWRIDDVTFTGLAQQPFAVQVAHRNLCDNRPPTVSGTPDLQVNEREEIALVPGNAADRDGDVLTHTWTQLSGPTATIANGILTGPEVTKDEVLDLRLTVSDGRGGEATDDFKVTVKNVNRPPAANAGPAQTVTAGATVTLMGEGTDPDGDALTYHWVQTGGLAVTLSDANVASPTFTAPPVDDQATVIFTLVVRDAAVISEPSEVVITVNRGGCGCASVDAFSLLALLAAASAVRRRRR